jgi:sugar phosphate isomerase/epimerase
MYMTGFADEASIDLDIQIKATKELGWSNIETRKLGDKNLATLTDAEFDDVCAKLDVSGVKFNCYGSGIANWAKPITEDPESSYEEFRLAIPRMHKLGTKMVRVMSFAVPDELKPNSWDYTDEVIKRCKVLTKMAEDAGVICVHENCMNWGGLSYEHTLRLLNEIDSPAFKLVFDTGNPVFNKDWSSKGKGEIYQSAWEFYDKVRDHVVYIHIKDGYMPEDGGKHVFTYAGDGNGDVRKIIKDMLQNGYDGGISIEPHLAVVFHDENASLTDADIKYNNYVEYGHRMEKLIAEVKAEL